MIAAAAAFVDEHVAPKEDDEKEYLRRLDEASDYAPRLLFSEWPDVLARAGVSPAAEWKLLNLRKRPLAAQEDSPEW